MTVRQAKGALPGLLLRILKDRETTQAELAKLLGVSQKTLSRWLHGQSAPDLLQGHGLAVVLGAQSPGEAQEIREALGLTDPDAAQSAPNRAMLGSALEGALFEATETLGAPPQKVREAVAQVLDRVASLKVDARTAAKLVRGKR